jgi:hypothetical protein
MGLSWANGKKVKNRAQRLSALAGELEPKKAPWWVNQPSSRMGTPSQGWWWIPAGGQHPAFLGHNSITAEIQLQELINAGEKPR